MSTLLMLTKMLRVLADDLVAHGGLSPEAATAVHKIADEATGPITGLEHRRSRLSPLRYCTACAQWVENPCVPGDMTV